MIEIDKDFDDLGSGKMENSVFTFESRIYKDNRGEFTENWKLNGLPGRFSTFDWVKQSNMSRSSKMVFRGMHSQLGGSAQGKMVTCVNGSILDVIVDMRPNSATYKTMKAYQLGVWDRDSGSNKSLWVPRGFLHGFLSLEDNTIFQYLCDNTYDKSSECGANIMSLLNDNGVFNLSKKTMELVGLGTSTMTMSEKDKVLPDIGEYETIAKENNKWAKFC